MFIVQQDETNKILLDVDTDITSPYFLFVFTYYTGEETKIALFEDQSSNCDYHIIHLVEVSNYGTEDLNGGILSLRAGTWEYDLYVQSSDSNRDPDNATYVQTSKIQVIS